MSIFSRVGYILLSVIFLLTGCAVPMSRTSLSKEWPDPAIEGNLSENPSLKDDFCQFVNYDWYKTAKIPKGNSRWTVFNELEKNVKYQIINILKEPDGTVEQQKAANLFVSAMDTNTRDLAGNGALMRTFHFVKDVKTLEELNNLFAGAGALYYFTPQVVTSVGPDLKNSTMNVAYIYAPGLSLEDSAEYLNRTEQGERFKKANDKYYKALLMHNGIEANEAEKMILEAFEWEKQLANGIYSLETSYREDYFDLIYNVYSPEELYKISPNFPLKSILEVAGLDGAKKFIVSEPEAVKTLNEVYRQENLSGIKAYLMINLLDSIAPYGDSFSESVYIDCCNEKYGSTGVKPIEERAYGVCNNLIGELLGKIYANKYFDESSKNEIIDMTNEIIETFKKRISMADWLSLNTKEIAIEKLNSLTLRIGYPDKYCYSWENINITDENPLIENVENIVMLLTAQTNEKVDKPVDNDIWEMSVNTVNAYYSPLDNSINFPAAILQGPFYEKNRSKSANLGAIGAVIAHEITHAFDTRGSQFDKEGNMNDWWTKEDRIQFKKRTDKVEEYYSSIKVIGDEHVRGDLTIGETVADLGAIACTLDIMKNIENAEYEDYFRAFANIWVEQCTPERRIYLLKNDPHAPGYLRANITLQQYEEFYKTYGIKNGDFMYLIPSKRLIVW